MKLSVEAFSARVHKLGINPCVDVPEPVVAALLRAAGKSKGPVPVKGELEGAPFEATVVRYRGAWRLYLNTAMRKNAGVGVGDAVRIILAHDPVPRMPPMPEALRVALAVNTAAKARWRLQPSSRRKEILAYLNSLKTRVSLERNVRKVIETLTRPRN
jgi:hypothetical protein